MVSPFRMPRKDSLSSFCKQNRSVTVLGNSLRNTGVTISAIFLFGGTLRVFNMKKARDRRLQFLHAIHGLLDHAVFFLSCKRLQSSSVYNWPPGRRCQDKLDSYLNNFLDFLPYHDFVQVNIHVCRPSVCFTLSLGDLDCLVLCYSLADVGKQASNHGFL